MGILVRLVGEKDSCMFCAASPVAVRTAELDSGLRVLAFKERLLKLRSGCCCMHRPERHLLQVMF